jgi:hypothetical protein
MADVQILQCPGCKEYIASDAQSCRFCRRPLDSQTIKTAVAATKEDNKKYRRSHYLKHLLTGFGLFVGGTLLTVMTAWAAFTSESGGYYVVTWGLIVTGFVDFLYGLYGYIEEVLSKK